MRCIRTTVYTCALATVLAFSPATGTAAEKTRNVATSRIDSSSINIDNFGQVNPAYYRGGQPNGQDYADLAALGIKTVIDLQKDGSATEGPLVESAGMKFYRIPMTTHEPPTRTQLAVFLQLVNDPANQPVYVHCAGGRHRTGLMTAVYRMTRDGWTADQAFSEMKQYHFGADFLHSEFKQFVYAYRTEPERPTPGQHVVATAAAK
jgi:protein tyrosine/serine phosphatase